MNSKILTLLSALLFCLMLAGCGEDPAIVKFENDIDAFCARAAEIDAAINAIDAESENASKELLAYLDELDQTFKVLSEISVPEKYAYMEQLTSEASSYMTTAVSAYHEAFANDSYNETTAAYARENYERACKRVTVLLQLLRGEEVSGATVETVSQ